MNPRAPTFSRRLPADLTPNRFTGVLARLREQGARLIDLTETNPTRVGLEYPERTLAPLASPRSLVYDPVPFGLEEARAAVAGEFARRGLAVDPSAIVLTASTSEAYALLFKLLCDPGDQVLVPRPSYPLFEHLTRLDSVETVPYHLHYHGAWSVNLDEVVRAITPRARALLAVSPNNPTGSFLSRYEVDELGRIAARHGLALVGDEVFADFVVDEDRARERPSVLEAPDALTVSLGGLSKSAGLPQLKLGWMAVGGPPDLVRAALSRLEIICDTYLSVATPVQRAAAALMESGAGLRGRILERIRANHRDLVASVAAHPSSTLLPVGGGWSAVVQVPAVRSEESLILRALEEDHVIVHPGYFFDFPFEAFLVVSLLPDPEAFRTGVERLLARAAS